MDDCLDEDTLLDLAEGRRELGADDAVTLHLDRCESCRRLVAEARRGVAPDEPRDTPYARGAAVGRYVLDEAIGAGATGVVWAAYDPELDRRVALKFLRGGPHVSAADLRTRLSREAQAMAQLSHANVVVVHDVGTFDDQVYVAMELVDGATLGDWLAARPRRWREVLEVFRAAGAGLAAAHAAGLVHRDFKPDNVLIGRDGRVRVTDFGLARAVGGVDEEGDAAPPSGGGSDRLLDARLTRSGALVGTPAYMAPEQIAGGRVDARSDLFSFCVALFEALYGVRPFTGANLQELAAAMRAGRIATVTRRGVPRRVHRAVLRGLAADPAARWPAMEPLLHALAAGQHVTIPRVAAAGVAVAGLIAALAFARASRAPLCTGAAAAWGDLWSAPARAAVEQRFAAIGRPSATAAFAAIDDALARYRDAFLHAHENACRDTRVYHTQSAEALDLRISCLEEAHHHAAALVRLYSDADGQIVDRAVATLDELTPLDDCADARALAAPDPAPRDPQRRRVLADLQARAAEASALAYARKSGRSLELVEPLIGEAQKLGWAPLVARLLLVRARDEQNLARHDAAVASLHRAAETALGARDDADAADAWNMLVWNRGVVLAFRAEAEEWARYADAAIRRLGGDDEREGTRLFNLGSVLVGEARLDEARALLVAARERMLKSRGPHYWRIASVDDTIGRIDYDAGRVGDALAIHHRASDLRVHTLGPDHPLVGASLAYEARDLTALGRVDEALPMLDRVLALMHAEGPDVEDGWVRQQRAEALRVRGDKEGALDEDRRALANEEAHRRADDPWLCGPLVGIGIDLVGLERLREARAPLERALPLCQRDNDHFALAETQVLLSRVLVAGGGDRARAAALAGDGRRELERMAHRYGAYYADALRTLGAPKP
jgi:tetratricopeptide (TPR) repeat protein